MIDCYTMLVGCLGVEMGLDDLSEHKCVDGRCISFESQRLDADLPMRTSTKCFRARWSKREKRLSESAEVMKVLPEAALQ